MHHAVRIILSFALAGVVCAQDRVAVTELPAIDQLATERLARENEASFQERDRRQQEAAEWTERRFLNFARQFVQAWNDFVRVYDSGVYDVRKAARLAEAFHKLERAAGWVRPEEDSDASHSQPSAEAR